ncbi:MAG TPA: GNAT family N-acetyltransferase [Actinobacteria bacterium]|jgi:GNAT superfamily N-acetyltransferase|nr:GNAT family N-acetyltransferase [Actinomycetota bacterium]
MEIRDVRPEEYAEAGRVTALAYREYAPPESKGWREYLGQIADVAGRAERTPVLIAVEDGRIVGTATVEIDEPVEEHESDRLLPEEGGLRMLGVDPAYRGRGIGRALVEASRERIRAAGKTVMALRTTAPMTTAQALYTSMGFVRDPSRDWADETVSLLFFRLPLT